MSYKPKKVKRVQKIDPSRMGGTSLHGYIKTSRTELRKTFGNPNMGPSGDGKVKSSGWVVSIDGKVATIYDRRDADKKGDKFFHIGGRDMFAPIVVAQELSKTRGEKVHAIETSPEWDDEKRIYPRGHDFPDSHPIITPTRAMEYSKNVGRYRAEGEKDSCCCGATKIHPCACMIQGIETCSATCPCSLEKKGAESFGDRVCNICNEIKPTRAYKFGRFVGMYEPVQVIIRDYCDPCAESDGLTITKDAEGIGQWEIGEQLEEAQMNAEDEKEKCPLCSEKIDFEEAYIELPRSLCDGCYDAVMEKRHDHAYSAELIASSVKFGAGEYIDFGLGGYHTVPLPHFDFMEDVTYGDDIQIGFAINVDAIDRWEIQGLGPGGWIYLDRYPEALQALKIETGEWLEKNGFDLKDGDYSHDNDGWVYWTFPNSAIPTTPCDHSNGNWKEDVDLVGDNMVIGVKCIDCGAKWSGSATLEEEKRHDHAYSAESFATEGKFFVCDACEETLPLKLRNRSLKVAQEFGMGIGDICRPCVKRIKSYEEEVKKLNPPKTWADYYNAPTKGIDTFTQPFEESSLDSGTVKKVLVGLGIGALALIGYNKWK